MIVKKEYNIGDTVWLYGIARHNNKLIAGKIIHSFTLEHAGYDDEPHYVVAIPNEIEPLLEIRTWHNMSQDGRGPIGAFRQEVSKINMDAVDKKLSQLGLNLDDDNEYYDDEPDPTPEQIHAALEKSKKAGTHGPLVIKENKPTKRRNYPRKKKRESQSGI